MFPVGGNIFKSGYFYEVPSEGVTPSNTRARQVAHRDLKSLNILMRKGTCKISDFGLSKVDDGATVASFLSFQPLTHTPEP